jgi:hypothetical protein
MTYLHGERFLTLSGYVGLLRPLSALVILSCFSDLEEYNELLLSFPSISVTAGESGCSESVRIHLKGN